MLQDFYIVALSDVDDFLQNNQLCAKFSLFAALSMQKSLDVIIPSFRVNESDLLPILSLKGPPDFDINFIIIADNPLIKVPASIESLALQGRIKLIVNEVNLGFSETRNKGLNAAESDWILLLDDDIVTEKDMLQVFCDAIRLNPEYIGYIGVTNFPPPINRVTKAFTLNTGGQYNVGRFKKEHVWFPTANIALNRKRLGDRRFLKHLTKGGEDIEFFSRNSFENGEKYIALPDATVIHPWWSNGKSQLKRMFNYGWGTSDIIELKLIKTYTFYNFPSTPETIFFLLLLAVFIIPITGTWIWVPVFISIFLFAEYLTNLIKSVIFDKSFSPLVALQMMLHKNANELGYLCGCLFNRKFSSLTKRLDVGFNKPNPSPYRFNKWKIIKLLLILGGLALYVSSN